MGDTNAVKEVDHLTKGKGVNNLSFPASWQPRDAVDTERASEGAVLARTYAPSRVGNAVTLHLWHLKFRVKYL
jgi:hypothetical protein